MLKPFDERTTEIAAHLNPALGSLILWEFVNGYETIEAAGPEYPLIFLPMALVLHKPTRSLMPPSQTTRLQMWLSGHPQVRIELDSRVSQLAPFVREAFLIAVSRNMLEITLDARVASLKKVTPHIRSKQDVEVREIMSKASLCGKWFAQINDATTLFVAFGLRI